MSKCSPIVVPSPGKLASPSYGCLFVLCQTQNLTFTSSCCRCLPWKKRLQQSWRMQPLPSLTSPFQVQPLPAHASLALLATTCNQRIGNLITQAIPQSACLARLTQSYPEGHSSTTLACSRAQNAARGCSHQVIVSIVWPTVPTLGMDSRLTSRLWQGKLCLTEW